MLAALTLGAAVGVAGERHFIPGSYYPATPEIWQAADAVHKLTLDEQAPVPHLLELAEYHTADHVLSLPSDQLGAAFIQLAEEGKLPSLNNKSEGDVLWEMVGKDPLNILPSNFLEANSAAMAPVAPQTPIPDVYKNEVPRWHIDMMSYYYMWEFGFGIQKFWYTHAMEKAGKEPSPAVVKYLTVASTWFDILANFHISAACSFGLYNGVGSLEKKAAAGESKDVTYLGIAKAYQGIRQNNAFLQWTTLLIVSEYAKIWHIINPRNTVAGDVANYYGMLATRAADWCFSEWHVSELLNLYELQSTTGKTWDKMTALKFQKVFTSESFIWTVKTILQINYLLEDKRNTVKGAAEIGNAIPFLGMKLSFNGFAMGWLGRAIDMGAAMQAKGMKSAISMPVMPQPATSAATALSVTVPVVNVAPAAPTPTLQHATTYNTILNGQGPMASTPIMYVGN